MKKSIFLIFAAILCAMSVNAKTIYLNTGGSGLWNQEGATFGVHAWKDGGQSTTTMMTLVPNEADIFQAEIVDEATKCIFLRMDNSNSFDWNKEWNRKGDLTIPAGKNCCTVSGWGGNTENVSWSTYTPDAPKTYKDITFTITANAAPQIRYWDGGDKMVGSDWNNLPTMTATGNANEYTYTVKDVDEAKGVKYLLKIGNVQTSDQTTSENVIADFKDLMPEVYVKGVTGWTGDGHKMTIADDYASASVTITLAANLTADLKLTIGGTWMGDTKNAITKDNNSSVFDTNDKNGSIKTDIAGDYIFTYTYADQTLTVTYPTEEIEVAVDCYVTGNTALTGEDWVLDSENLKMTKVEGTEKYTYTFTALPANTAFELKVVYANSQKGFSSLSEAIDGVTANGDNICFTLEETGDVTVTYDAETEKIALTGNFAIPVTYDYYIVGSFNGDNPKKAENGMTLDGTVYKATVTLAAGDNTLKVTKGSWDPTWGYTELGAAYEEVSDAGAYNNIKITLAAEKEITVIFEATAGKITFENLTEKVIEYGVTFNVTVPEGTEACYICGEWDWTTFKPMTYVDDTHYTLTIDNATKDHKYKYTFGEAWAYVEKNADGSDVQDRTWTENDVVAAWADPLATNIYLAGSMTNWAEGKIEFMKETPDATIATVAVELPVGDNTFKIIKGETWLGNGGIIDNSITGWTFKDGDSDCTLKATYAATYVFTWDLTKEDQQLSVTYPTVETLNYPSLPKTLVKTWRTAYTELDLGNYNTITIFNHDGTDFTYGDDFEVIASLDEVNLEGTGSWKLDGDDEVLTATLYNEEKTAIYHITASTTAPKTYTLTCTDAQYAPTAYSTIFSGTADGKALMIDIQMMEVGLNEAFGSCSWDGIEITSTAATVSRDLLDNDKYNVSGVFNDAAGNTYNITITGAKPKPAATLNITGATFTEESWGGVVIAGTWDTEALGGSLDGADFGTYGYAELYTDSHYLSSVGDVTFAQASDGVSVVLTGKFSDMMDATPYDVTITGTLVEFVAPSIELTTGDNETTIETYAWETVDATIKRTFVAEDGWYTLCVPFGMDASLIGEAYEITSINKNDKTQGIDVTFSDVDYLWAGYPYLIKPTATVTNPVIEGVEIEYTTGEEHTVTGDGIKITMTGIINGGGTTNGTTEYYVGANGYLYNQATTKQGLCALFTITDLEGNPTRVRARVVTGENATTGVDDIFTTDVPVKAIVNGQLIIIRGNEKFNAQGQKL